ncbi:putative disease resistance protein RGA3 [Quercus robur]|uniref:putative disease resistance protein RGA3 n=1 Tax=Quercus robur TaxID=38942 RepID=UPI002162C77E|nr:putative disease resistance protein RGA3 [Quercus robur]
MAEVAYGIAGKVLEQLGSRTFQEISSAWGVRSDLKKLEHTVSAIKAVLCDAEERQASDQSLRTWLGELKDVLHDAENVLDEFHYRVLQKEAMKRYGSTKKKVCYFFSGSNPLVFHVEMAHKIKNVRERVDAISGNKDKFNLAPGHEPRNIKIHKRDMTHSFVDPSNVIGRDDDRKEIIRLLMNPDDRRNVNVIPIVGLGGLGKTALAKLVYNDKLLVSHFQLRMWVCASEDFNVTSLIKEILKSAIVKIDENFGVDGFQNNSRELLRDKKFIDNLGVDELQFRLRKLLKDKKFLLVLDDVWNEDRNKWMELEDLLLGGCNGSKIMVTTRNSSVATIMGTVPTYHLDGLSHEDCMSLFKKLAFKELLEIGNDIVKKCKGVPLAVRTLASLLYLKVDEREWKSVRDNEIWHLKQNEGDILPVLRLSYNQLPFHLKQCFAYCSLFPKDYEFKTSLLVQFWMAHGLLQSPDNEKQQLEDIGELNIKELMSRSLFQDVYKDAMCDYNFKMHDLVHDLAISIAKGECSVVTKTSTPVAEVCHLSILESGQEVTTQLERLSKVQTVIFKTEQPMSILKACTSRFKYLRVLDLSNSSFEMLPNSIGSLKHLRYLDLTRNGKIKQLPNSICKLHSLQTLRLGGCNNLERLPKGVRDIISLRFLVITTKHTCLSEKTVGCLDSLRFLLIRDCENLKCLFEEMEGRLTYLRTLVVLKCPSLISLSLSIKHLTALETLGIRDCKELSLMEMEGEDNQDLKFSLQNLIIGGLPKLEVLPQWLQRSANTLQLLWIGECENFTALPEWLPCLESLHTLTIGKCPKLSSLPEGMEALTALRQLVIEGCPNLSRKCREEDSHKIAHVPKIALDKEI